MLRFLLILVVVLSLVYLLGPRAKGVDVKPELPTLELTGEDLEDHLRKSESAFSLKMDNEARIVWADDSLKTQTEYVLLYLHGFSASQEEGDPLHEAFGRRYGMNVFLARIAGHGLQTTEPFIDLDASEMVHSALQALSIGKQLGKKVILMGCSTGGTLALYLAAHFPDKIHSILLYSPNIDLFDANAKILTRPWGVQFARWVVGSKYREWNPSPEASQYWYGKYRLEGLASLKALIDDTMNESTFHKIEQPVLMLYYFKNENEQDKVVSVERMHKMFTQIRTPNDQKREFAMPHVGHHILTSRFFSKDLESVQSVTQAFAEEILRLKPLLAQ